MRAMGVGAAMLVLSWALAPVALTAPMDRAIYMNTFYCAGAAALYGERLGNSDSSSYRRKGRTAGEVAGILRSRAKSYGARRGFGSKDGERAETQGRQTMAGLLPQNGAWRTGAPIPRDAFRQYQHCATLAGR